MAQASTRFRPQDFTILIASDDNLVAQSLAANLEAGAYHVSVMRTLKEIQNAVKAEQFDLFILDSSLDGGMGVDFLSSLQNDDRFIETPSFILVDKGEKTDEIRSLKGSTFHLVKKPLNIGKLAEEVMARWREENPDLLESHKKWAGVE